MLWKTIAVVGAVAVWAATGCTRIETSTFEEGVQTSHQRTVGGFVVSQLEQKLAMKTVTGEGSFTHDHQLTAREGAKLAAIADMASKAGEVLVEQDTRIFNDEVINKMRLQAANIVHGYEVVKEEWDPETKTHKVTIEQSAWSIVERMSRRFP